MQTHPYNYEVLQFLLEKIQEQGESKETVKVGRTNWVHVCVFLM